MLYVSLHVPKTAGNTLRQVLQGRFGDRVQLAYNERDNLPTVSDPVCIHGHAVFRAFSHIIAAHAEKRYLTFLREPLSSAVSAYYFAKRPFNHRGEPSQFVDRGIEKWLTHEEPFQDPNPPGYNHNRFSQWFEQHPIEAYDFIGVMEQFDESLLIMYRLFGWDWIPYRRENVGGYRHPQLAEHVIRRFRALNEKDYGLYECAATLLAQHRREYGAGFEADLAAFRRQLREHQVGEQRSESYR